MSRLWQASATLALLAVAELLGLVALAVADDPSWAGRFWLELIVLGAVPLWVVAAVWCARRAGPPTQAVVCGAAGVTAIALGVGLVLMASGRGYLGRSWRPPGWFEAYHLMAVPAAALLAAGAAVARDRWRYDQPGDDDSAG